VLVTDLPVKRRVNNLQAMKLHDLAPVFLAAPTSPDARLQRIAKVSQGFVYAVSRTGVTGGAASACGRRAATCAALAGRVTSCPSR